MQIKHIAMAIAAAAASITANTSSAALVATGSFQGWNPPTGPTMVETSAGSGIYSVSLTGVPSGLQTFKILDDGGDGAAWGDTELTPTNSWFLADGAGNATLTIDTNTYSDGFSPSTKRISVSNDVTTIFATGNYMAQAGGAGDWSNNDPAFAMSSLGSGLYGLTKTIATPGTYEFKATKGDWDGQFGADGRNINASTWLFTTTMPNQSVTFYTDTARGAISVVVPEPTTLGLLAGAALVGLRRRK